MSFDAVDFIRRVAEGVGAQGIGIVYSPGWENRGNGGQWIPGGPQGHVNHHTAGGNNIYIDNNLITGVPGLSGPLCNYCIMYDGDLGVIAAYPANHAGASGGWDTAPLPVTGWFNSVVLGTEIQYRAQDNPMSDAQWRTMCVLNAVLVREGGWDESAITCKNHQGTSIQGKWDPGYPPGKTYDIAEQRKGFVTALGEQPNEGDWTVGYQEDIRNQQVGSATLGEYPGWPARRYHLAEDQQPRFSQLDFAREADAKLCSQLPVFGDPNHKRPVPPEEDDDIWGHLLSLRAEFLQTLELVKLLAKAAGVSDTDIKKILERK